MQVYDKELQEELEEIRQTRPVVWSYILHRANATSDAKAMLLANRSESWLYTLEDREYVNELALRLKADAPQHALTLLQQAATKAAQNMLDLANNASDERVKFQANKDIMDRLGMRAPDKLQIEAGASIRDVDEVINLVFGPIAKAKMLQAGQDQGGMIDGVLGDVTEADE